MAEIPYTWSDYVDTPCRRVVNLAAAGVEGIPVLGVNRAASMSAGSVFHRHECLEITVCERGSVKFDMDGRAWTLLPGLVFVTQPGEVHRLRSNARGSVLHWMFVKPPCRGAPSLSKRTGGSGYPGRHLRPDHREPFARPAAGLLQHRSARLFFGVLVRFGHLGPAPHARTPYAPYILLFLSSCGVHLFP